MTVTPPSFTAAAAAYIKNKNKNKTNRPTRREAQENNDNVSNEANIRSDFTQTQAQTSQQTEKSKGEMQKSILEFVTNSVRIHSESNKQRIPTTAFTGDIPYTTHRRNSI